MTAAARPVCLSSGLPGMLRFHLGAGARLALRAMAPASAAAVAVLGMNDDPSAAMERLAIGVAGWPGDPVPLMALFVLTTAVASWAAPRVTRGLNGWTRHLPASGDAHRRAAGFALVIVQTPLLIAVLALAAVAAARAPVFSTARLVGLPLLAMGAAMSALPVRRRAVASVLGMCAAAGGLAGSWVALAAGGVALAAADRVAGPIARGRSERAYREAGRPVSAMATHMRVMGRALGWRALAPLATSMIPVAACAMLVSNNQLAGGAAAPSARLAGGLAITLLLAGGADLVAFRRPAWPWLRSLPLSSTRRVACDALALGIGALAPVSLVALLAPRAAAPLCAMVPLLALRASGLIHRAPRLRSGAGGRLMAEGFVLSGLVCLLPWVGWLLLPVTPLALRAARRQERRQKVTLWDERHHLAAGDPISWSSD